MDAVYWEGVGDAYEQEIFDSALEDRHGVLLRALDEHADAGATACDLGCGVGHYLPLLAARFGRVVGVDFAGSLLAQARELCGSLSNVELLQVDLSASRRRVTGRGGMIHNFHLFDGDGLGSRGRRDGDLGQDGGQGDEQHTLHGFPSVFT